MHVQLSCSDPGSAGDPLDLFGLEVTTLRQFLDQHETATPEARAFGRGTRGGMIRDQVRVGEHCVLTKCREDAIGGPCALTVTTTTDEEHGVIGLGNVSGRSLAHTQLHIGSDVGGERSKGSVPIGVRVSRSIVAPGHLRHLEVRIVRK